MQFRKATEKDIDAIAQIYANIHTAEERGEATIGWERGVYPERITAENALARGDLFVEVEPGTSEIVGTAILNKIQVETYAGAPWEAEVPDEEVYVMHTLVIDPGQKGKGYGQAFARFYEEQARELGCTYLRIDTNAKNKAARTMYRRLGYREIDIVPCTFNGMPGVDLVLLEKRV